MPLSPYELALRCPGLTSDMLLSSYALVVQSRADVGLVVPAYGHVCPPHTLSDQISGTCLRVSASLFE
eukprot:1762809-Rhodomonas_salina.6